MTFIIKIFQLFETYVSVIELSSISFWILMPTENGNPCNGYSNASEESNLEFMNFSIPVFYKQLNYAEQKLEFLGLYSKTFFIPTLSYWDISLFRQFFLLMKTYWQIFFWQFFIVTLLYSDSSSLGYSHAPVFYSEKNMTII